MEHFYPSPPLPQVFSILIHGVTTSSVSLVRNSSHSWTVPLFHFHSQSVTKPENSTSQIPPLCHVTSSHHHCSPGQVTMAPSMESLFLIPLHSSPSFLYHQKYLSKNQTWPRDSDSSKFSSNLHLWLSSCHSDPQTLHHSHSDGMACCFLKHQRASKSQLKGLLLYQAFQLSQTKVVLLRFPNVFPYFCFCSVLCRSPGSLIYPFAYWSSPKS